MLWFAKELLITAGEFVPLHSQTHAEPTSSKFRSGYEEGALHFEMRRWRFVFGSSELPQIELVVENIAEVDAAGRYIPFPLVCRWLTMPSRTPLGAYYIYQRRGYHSVCLQLRLWKASNCKTGRSQIPRFSFVVNGTSIKQSDSGCLADILQERMNQNELKYKVFDWLRFPLIVFVVYIHSFGKPIDFYAIDFSNPMPMDYYNLFRISISHVLTHIAVPMFFFISGFLFFNKLQEWNRTVYFDKLKKRIKTRGRRNFLCQSELTFA